MRRMFTARARLAAAVLACVALLLPGLELVTAGPAAASTAHPYSDPVWFPLHINSFKVGCVGDHSGANNDATAGTRCDVDHRGYFGIDIDIPTTGPQHPDIFPAGAGKVLKITRVSGSCVPAGGHGSGGNEVVVDHGGGIVSVYQHLQTITVGLAVGSPVTPSTPVGTAGATGAFCNKTTGAPAQAYLDFQIHRYGSDALTSSTTIATLQGCNGGSAVDMPGGLPASDFTRVDHTTLSSAPATWVDVPYLTTISTGGINACLPTGSPVTPSAPTNLRAVPHNGSVTLAWTPPTTAPDRYVAQVEIYRPSLRSWSLCTQSTSDCNPGWFTATGSATTKAVPGLTNGREFRFRLSAHNATGWSVPSAGWVRATPFGRASAPTFSHLTSTAHSVRLYWTMTVSALNGGTLRGFEVAIDSVRNGHATAWRYSNVIASVRHRAWKARANTRYRVKVRARTNAGYGAWMRVRAVTTPRS